MKWTYRIPNKLGTSLLLMVVLALVLVNNLRERSNSKQLETAFESIYADRLMAESYILSLSEQLHQIQELLETSPADKDKALEQNLSEIDRINLLYLDTKLTEDEERHFDHFETLTWEITKSLREGKHKRAISDIDAALRDLHLLSEIQVSEAQSLLTKTAQIFRSGSLISQFEIGLVILIGLMVQGMLFASKSLQVREKQVPENLN
ncbi:hypothetical protein J0A67_02165 [Algoriphagus aestuariicola]|jgi:hypothetical protein|uniref:Chemotaxis methyl-accepting receptor HlyB-like 4HB MCP domain-containing protein n=1 Tax=Algoriphagus aestuariicola TaxID=1852016 RepID=A0ABS3BKW9_9BACT|nr:hypothetical protein [Algoriphagus aestuariicola]MBN7799642.1 hypothetical protein [Algoriphagus aestuariicola]